MDIKRVAPEAAPTSIFLVASACGQQVVALAPVYEVIAATGIDKVITRTALNHVGFAIGEAGGEESIGAIKKGDVADQVIDRVAAAAVSKRKAPLQTRAPARWLIAEHSGSES